MNPYVNLAEMSKSGLTVCAEVTLCLFSIKYTLLIIPAQYDQVEAAKTQARIL